MRSLVRTPALLRHPEPRRSASSAVTACLTAGAAAFALAGCGSGPAVVAAKRQAISATRSARPNTACAARRGFALSLVQDRGGQATPVAAAAWLAKHGEIGGIPLSGWRLTNENREGATVVSGRAVLHAIRGSDGTWQVDSGYTCS